MCGEQGLIAVHETVHLVKFIGKGSSCYAKVLRYSSRIRVIYLATEQRNKLIQFPVCANFGVLFILDILSQACEKDIQTRFSL